MRNFLVININYDFGDFGFPTAIGPFSDEGEAEDLARQLNFTSLEKCMRDLIPIHREEYNVAPETSDEEVMELLWKWGVQDWHAASNLPDFAVNEYEYEYDEDDDDDEREYGRWRIVGIGNRSVVRDSEITSPNFVHKHIELTTYFN